MTTPEFDFVVIGGGPGGQKAAVQAVKAGARVLLVEREQAVGGECVRRGTIPSKALRHSAMVHLRWMNSFGGTEQPVRCGSTLAALLAHQDRVTRGHEQYMTRQLSRNGITVWRGHASFVGPDELSVRAIDGSKRQVKARFIVIATGSRPRTPANVPVDHENILDSDSILALPYLPESLVVLGGGVIATEFATVLGALGVRVTMVDKADRPLAFLDPELTDRLVADFERTGGRYLAKSSLKSIEFDGISKVVTVLEDGTRLETDKGLCALGRTAQVGGLDLAKAGLAVNSRGTIEVDANCRTKVETIYAVGDVIGPPALAATSMEQGRRAVRHALGLEGLSSKGLTPVGIYAIPEIATIGLTEAEARAKFGGTIVGRARFEELARGLINDDERGLLKLICTPDGRRLVGAHIVGDGATELIHVAQMALAAESDVDVFLENIFNFPTFAEGFLVAALDVYEQRQALARAA